MSSGFEIHAERTCNSHGTQCARRRACAWFYAIFSLAFFSPNTRKLKTCLQIL